MSSNSPRIVSLILEGYRPFREFEAQFLPLEIIVGSNGSGKSSLFEFLRFLRDAMSQDIPPEIIWGETGRQFFHRPGPDKFLWSLETDMAKPVNINYEGRLVGPIGKVSIHYEMVTARGPYITKDKKRYDFLSVREQQGYIQDFNSEGRKHQKLRLRRPNQLALSTATNPDFTVLYELREFISGWRFYSAFNIDIDKIRRAVPTQQTPALYEDAGNLSAVLFYLMTEHRDAFDELQTHLRSVIPGFRDLTVKARGGPGEIIAFWRENGVDEELSLADLSDGILRFLCWAVLCVMPNPPTLICIDEPDQGVHPRTLPVLAGLFQKACQRTQILLATHASYFLTQFPVEHLAVMKKVSGEAVFTKPKDSKALIANLEEFGPDELEAMHRGDELENLS